MYLPGNRIALIDFGMVGRLSPVSSQADRRSAGGTRRAHDEGDDAGGCLLDWARR